jgi:hypothetical protein
MFASKDLFFTKPSGGYQISRSVRLRNSASAYFNRTPASASNRQTWTYSGWVKRGLLTTRMPLLGGYTGTTNGTLRTDITILDGAALNVGSDQMQTATDFVLQTTQLLRDPSAWYHIVVAFDTTQATSTNRVKIYVNGVQITAFSTASYPSLNYQGGINFNSNQYINRWYDSGGGNYYGDGYITEVNFIDGQALTPSSFGQTNTVTGVWQPIKYTGTYGTNGFYLNFSDNSNNTATTIGKDYSGNGNNWTPNNISVTAGATYDSMLDVPTPYADGGNGRGNYCTLNPNIQRWGVPNSVFSNANLSITTTVASSAFGFGTMFMSTGKWYWEGTLTAAGTATPGTGLADNQVQSGTFTNLIEYNKDGTRTGGASWATYTTNDVIGVAMDCDGLSVSFYKNNTLQGSISLTSGVAYAPLMDVVSNASWAANFGQRSFTYTPPTGFVALNTQNLPTPTISNGANYMAATLYQADGSSNLTISNAVNGISFQPDFAWIKTRSAADNNALWDSVRGNGVALFSDLTNAQQALSQLSSLNSNGFTVLYGAGQVNYQTRTYVAWQWKAGGAGGSSNTSGSITSTVSVNATAGFSVATYTGNGTAGATVGHGLGVTPSMVIIKSRTGGTSSWLVWFTGFTGLEYILLESTAAKASASSVWNSTAPNSTVVTLGTGSVPNTSTWTYVMYSWAAVAGYSKFGSYTGNGSTDGPFVFTGFRPRFILFKSSSNAQDWVIYDTSRDTYNVESNYLLPNTAGAEAVYANADFLSNGFKMRSSASLNYSGWTYIYAAFAESPFKLALAR